MRTLTLPCWALLATLSACGGPADPRADGAPEGARAVPRGSIQAAALASAVLDECHRPLMHRMQRVKATVSTPDGRALLVQARLPTLGRVREGRAEWLVRGATAMTLDGDDVDAERAAELRDLLAVVDAAAFGPLHRGGACSARGDGFEVVDGNRGVHVTLFTDTLLPSSFTVDGDRVEIADYLRTSASWVARVLRHPRLGACRVVFEDGGLDFPDGYFEVRQAASAPKPVIRAPIPGAVVETQSSTPIVVDGKATQLWMLSDPGDWDTRHARYRDAVSALQDQNQRVAGFPCLFVEEDHRGLMAAPFRQRKGGPAFEAPAGAALREVPAGRVLVVYPNEGDLNARISAGKVQLERALANRKLTAAGPIIAQPFVHLHEAPPDADALRDTTVRVWVRIE